MSYIQQGTTSSDLQANFEALAVAGAAVYTTASTNLLTTGSSIYDLSDVTTGAGASTGYVLTYTGGVWAPMPSQAGDGTGITFAGASYTLFCRANGRAAVNPANPTGSYGYDATTIPTTSITTWRDAWIYYTGSSPTGAGIGVAGVFQYNPASSGAIEAAQLYGLTRLQVTGKIEIDIPINTPIYFGIVRSNLSGHLFMTGSMAYVPASTIERKGVTVMSQFVDDSLTAGDSYRLAALGATGINLPIYNPVLTTTFLNSATTV